MGWFSKDNNAEKDIFLRRRLDMVDRQIAGRDVYDSAVLDALRRVPRHKFVPVKYRDSAYEDSPLPIGNDQTISQPYIVGSMTEQLHPDKAKSVLEIGTGSGYQTAVLAELFGTVHTVEYFEGLSQKARRILDRLGYDNIEYYIGDGLKIPVEPAAFDAIIVTAAPESLPEDLINRLLPKGRLVIPVGAISQTLQVVSKDEDGRVSIEPLYAVRFVTLRFDS